MNITIDHLTEPTILRGAAVDWPAAKWTLESLRDRVGSAVVPIHTGRWKRAGWRIKRDGETTARAAATYIEEMMQGHARGYLAGFELLRAVPSLRADLCFPETGPFTTDVIWIGPAGTSTPIHFDLVPNVYTQLVGQKRWRLWRPERRLAPRFAGLGGFAMSDLDAGDGPDAAGPPDVDATLDPGDVLLLPAKWWHRVDTVSDSVAVNRWWTLGEVGKFIHKSFGQKNKTASLEPSGELRAEVVPCGEIDDELRQAMWTLFDSIYEDIDRERFEQDFAEKDHVILLFDKANASLQGFSTLRVYRRTIEGREVVVIYSGDTVIAPGYWGQRALQSAFAKYVTKCKLQHPFTPVYWFLISKGYKTYLLLGRNFMEHWPRRDKPTPAWQNAVLQSLATEKFGPHFIPEQGVVRFDRPMGRLRTGVAPIDPELLGDPDVRFFMEKNPGHAAGDELCCLGRVNIVLPFHYMGRLLNRQFARGPSK